MPEYFDTLETRDPELRESALLAALPRQIAHAKANAPAFARVLADVEPAAVTSRAALARLPVTRKSGLLDLQMAHRPFGGPTEQRAFSNHQRREQRDPDRRGQRRGTHGELMQE